MTQAEIIEKALKLAPWARELFVYRVMESLGLAEEAYVDDVSEAELARRWEESESGKVKWLSWEEVIGKLEKKFPSNAGRKIEKTPEESEIDLLEREALQLPELDRKRIAARLWEEPEPVYKRK